MNATPVAPRLILFYDTETSDMPKWSEPSGHPDQPHIVQLSARLVNEATREVVDSFDVTILQDGWASHPAAQAVHGVTAEYAAEHGIPEDVALDLLLAMWRRCDLRVGHEQSFDMRIIRIAIKRFKADDALADEWKAGASDCTCWKAMPLVKAPKAKGAGYKKPKLTEAYLHFFGRELESAHSSAADTDGCMAVYFAIADAAPTTDAPLATEPGTGAMNVY